MPDKHINRRRLMMVNFVTLEVTTAPSITYTGLDKNLIEMTITNNDALSATVYLDIVALGGTIDPTTDRGILASGASTVITFTGLAARTEYDFFAKALASGKTMSTTTGPVTGKSK